METIYLLPQFSEHVRDLLGAFGVVLRGLHVRQVTIILIAMGKLKAEDLIRRQ